MALNLIVPKSISRQDGKSIIAKAAYNARTQLRDERTGERTKDYGKLGGLEWQGVFLDPRRKNPELSEWMHDRQALYNACEWKADQSTRPKDAQLAREFLIALPHEFNADQRRMAMTDLGRLLARQGLIVDISIHEPDVHSDERNYHAHVLLGMHRIDENTGQLSAAKEREWNKKEWYQQVHERWSQLGGRYLERAGFKEEAERFRAGHLPREQQIERAEQRGDLEHADDLKNREATEHLGPHASAMERRGIATGAGNRNREIEERNRDRAELRDIDRRIEAIQEIKFEKTRPAPGQSRTARARDEITRPNDRPARDFPGTLRGGLGVGGRAFGKLLDKGAIAPLELIASLIDPPKTPKQLREEAIKAQIEREAQAERAEERRQTEASRAVREREVDRGR